MDPETKADIEEAIRIRTRMRVKDAEGRERIFRSTVAEKGDERKTARNPLSLDMGSKAASGEVNDLQQSV